MNCWVKKEIEGGTCLCLDLGCDNPARASLNREIVSQNLYIEGYTTTANALRGFPVFTILPDWIPQDELPFVDIKTLEMLARDNRLDDGEDIIQ